MSNVWQGTVHIKDISRSSGIPTSFCGVGHWTTAWAQRDRPATCEKCLEKAREALYGQIAQALYDGATREGSAAETALESLGFGYMMPMTDKAKVVAALKEALGVNELLEHIRSFRDAEHWQSTHDLLARWGDDEYERGVCGACVLGSPNDSNGEAVPCPRCGVTS